MFILHSLLKEFKEDFAHSRKGDERSTWFIYSIIAIIIPFTYSKTSNLLRCLQTLFGFSLMTSRRYYTFKTLYPQKGLMTGTPVGAK